MARTMAAGTTAFEASRTTPVMEPLTSCAVRLTRRLVAKTRGKSRRNMNDIVQPPDGGSQGVAGRGTKLKFLVGLDDFRVVGTDSVSLTTVPASTCVRPRPGLLR